MIKVAHTVAPTKIRLGKFEKPKDRWVRERTSCEFGPKYVTDTNSRDTIVFAYVPVQTPVATPAMDRKPDIQHEIETLHRRMDEMTAIPDNMSSVSRRRPAMPMASSTMEFTPPTTEPLGRKQGYQFLFTLFVIGLSVVTTLFFTRWYQ